MPRLVLSTFVSFSMLFLPCLTSAKDSSLSNEYQACINQYSDNTSWAGCGHQEIERQEASLNILRKEVFEELKKFQSGRTYNGTDMPLDRLIEEERKWVKWNDSACSYYNTMIMGREKNVLDYHMCKARIIAERISTLKLLLESIKGH